MSPPSDPIRVLHVDDEPSLADLVATYLERENSRLTVRTATAAADGLDILADTPIDCIVSDYDMPGQNGIDFLEAVRHDHPELPFILYTGKGSEDIAATAISAGVTDYLQKQQGTDHYAVLANRICNAVESYRSQQALAKRNRDLRRYERMINSMQEAACIYDPDGHFEVVNEYLADWYGTSREDLEGEPSNLIPHIRQQADAGDPYQELLNGDCDQLNGELAAEFSNHGEAVLEYRLTPLVVDDTIEGVVGVARDITERKRREQELRRNKRAMDEAPIGITITDPDQDDNPIIYANEKFRELTGYSTDEIIGRNCRFLQGEGTADEQVAAMRTAIENEEHVTVTLRNYRADGTEFWNQVSIAPVRDEDGTVVNFVGFQHDATERKLRDQELARVRDLLSRTETIADVGGWEIDTGTDDVFWTENLFDMLGVDYEEAPPLEEALDVYLEEDRARVAAAVETAVDAGESFDVQARYRRPTGEIRWFRIQGEPVLEGGDVVTLRGAVQDITIHKEREQELAQARQEYEELFNGMNDTGWVLDTDGSILAVNDAAVTTLGYSREDLRSMNVYDFDAGLSDAEIGRLIDGRPDDEVQMFETVHETKAGERIPVELSTSMISYKGQRAALSIGRDISDRKRREQQLETFASIVSHDLRNPLNVAEGNLELAQEECESDYLERVAQAHERMEVLIADLLTLAREGNQVSDMEVVDLAALAERCWQTVATAEATLEIETDLQIRADRSRLQQLLENLIRNAVEHAGETVSVTVGDHSDGFYVADDGPGIPSAEREQVFDTGYSTATEGTGFGLSIAKQVADAHGWEITLTTSADDGLRVEISVS